MRFSARQLVGCVVVLLVQRALCFSRTDDTSFGDSVALQTTSRVDQTALRKCNSGGLSARPIAISRSNVTCPCFLEYQFFPDTPSVWDVYLLFEKDALRWEASGYEGNPASFVSEYSAIGIETSGDGDGLAYQQTNVILEGAFRLIFRARATGRVCFLERDTAARNFFTFESMLPACPVVVQNPPLPPEVVEQRIVGGTEAASSKGVATFFPWIAVIWLGSRRSICGGSHIAPGYILTAAHCHIQKAISSFNVRIGNDEYDEGESFSISRIWVHEDYKLLDGGEAINDIAIIEIEDRDISKDADTVSINTELNSPSADEYVTTAGYGHLSEGWSAPLDPHRLRKVDVPVWSTADCKKVFSNMNPDMHICAGVKAGGCDSCQYVMTVVCTLYIHFRSLSNIYSSFCTCAIITMWEMKI